MLAIDQTSTYIAVTAGNDAIGRRWLRDATALPPVRLEERRIVERDFPAFCQRQSARIMELAKECRDPALKDQLVKIAADLLKPASGQVNGATPPALGGRRYRLGRGLSRATTT
jgi:hypothetical protein